MLGQELEPGVATRLSWTPSQSFDGTVISTPVLAVNGEKPGPVLCLTAAVHGDELNGIEIVRRVIYDLSAESLSGTVVGVPIVNLQGFRSASRYLSDRRDLNRYFPGSAEGSLASRIAYSFFSEVISHCDVLVDFHTGSFHRTNLPQLRADLGNADVKTLASGFGATVVLHSEGQEGTLRRAATDAGIPAVTLEAGEPHRIHDDSVDHGVKAIRSLLSALGMQKKTTFWGQPEPVYYQSSWVRADQGGILFSKVTLGQQIETGDVLGTVTDPITNRQLPIRSPHDGRVLGMALNQVVLPGFAAYRIGIEAADGVVAPEDPAPRSSAIIHMSERETYPETTDDDGEEAE
jgi:predicted deacylase